MSVNVKLQIFFYQAARSEKQDDKNDKKKTRWNKIKRLKKLLKELLRKKIKKTADSVDIEIDSVDIVEKKIVEIVEKKIVETAERKIADIVEKKIAKIIEIVEKFIAKLKTAVEIDLIDFLHQMKFLLKRFALTQLLHSFYSFFYYSCRQWDFVVRLKENVLNQLRKLHLS